MSIVPAADEIGFPIAGQVNQSAQIGQSNRTRDTGVISEQITGADGGNERRRDLRWANVGDSKANLVFQMVRFFNHPFHSTLLAIREILSHSGRNLVSRFQVGHGNRLGIENALDFGLPDEICKIDCRIKRHIPERKLRSDCQIDE